MRISDWSSDVCSSDLLNAVKLHVGIATDIIANGKSQITGHQRRAETDGKTALLAVPHIFRRGQEIVDIGVDSLCDCQQRFDVPCWERLPLIALEQLDSEPLLFSAKPPPDR